MNLFEQMAKEIAGKTGDSKKIYPQELVIGEVATIELEVAWRNEDDRREAEQVAAKYRHGIAKGGMISGLPASQGAMYTTSWSCPEAFFKKHPDEWECNSGEGTLVKQKAWETARGRMRAVRDSGFGFDGKMEDFQIGSIVSVIEAWLGNEYAAGFPDHNKQYTHIHPEIIKQGLIDGHDLKGKIWGQMFNFLNKTITLDKFGSPGTYPDMSFEIVEIKPLKQFLFRNFRVVHQLEFEKTGKKPVFLDQDEKKSK